MKTTLDDTSFITALKLSAKLFRELGELLSAPQGETTSALVSVKIKLALHRFAQQASFEEFEILREIISELTSNLNSIDADATIQLDK